MAAAMPVVTLLSAVLGAGAQLYVANKQEEARKDMARTDSMRRQENMETMTQENKSRLEAIGMENQIKSQGNAEAFRQQLFTLNDAAEKQKKQLELEKQLNKKVADPEYAQKFNRGVDEDRGKMDATTFLFTPNDSNLIRDNVSQNNTLYSGNKKNAKTNKAAGLMLGFAGV